MTEDLFNPSETLESHEDRIEETESLNKMNREPGSFLEKFLDYADAEAIQTFFTSLVQNIASAFQGAFQDYLDTVEPEPAVLSKNLAEPLQDLPVLERSEAADLIREELPAMDISLKNSDSTLEETSAPKLEQTVLTRHTVANDDMLSSIALTYYGRADLWPIIHEANRDLLGDNPGMIFPGQTLKIPTLESADQPPALTLSNETPPLVLMTARSPAASLKPDAPDDFAKNETRLDTSHDHPPEASVSAEHRAPAMKPEASLDTPPEPAASAEETVITNLDSGAALANGNLSDAVEELTGKSAPEPTVYSLSPLMEGLIFGAGYVGSRAAGAIPGISLGDDTDTDENKDEDEDYSTHQDSVETPEFTIPQSVIPIDMIADDPPPYSGSPSNGEIGEMPQLPVSAIPIEMIVDEEDQRSSGYSGYDSRPEIPPPDEILEDGTMVWHDGSRPDYSGGDMRIRPDGTFEIHF